MALIVRQSFPDLNLDTMLPALDEVIYDHYGKYPPQYTQIFRMKKSSRSIEQTSEVSSLGTFKVVPETEPAKYDAPLPVYNKTYTHLQYASGFKVSFLAQKFDKFGLISETASALGRSAQWTKEIVGASVFNNGFSSQFPGPDGVPLFSPSHPLRGGGVQANQLSIAADPDVDSLRMALTMMRRTVNHRGELVRIVPKTLVVPNSYEFVANELLGGDTRPDTANRAINSFRKRSGMSSFENVMVWDYLLDPKAWYVMAEPSETQLRWYDAEEFNVQHGIDFETRSIKSLGWMMFSVGFSSFYGILGVPSA